MPGGRLLCFRRVWSSGTDGGLQNRRRGFDSSLPCKSSTDGALV